MADAQLVTVEVQIPRELADVKDLIVGVAQDIKDGKPAKDMVFGALPNLQKAFEGISDIPAELKSQEMYMCAAVLVAELLGIFLKPKAEVVAAMVAGAAAGGATGTAAAAGVSQS